MAENEDLAEFVRAHIRSVWALELLLVLRRDRDRSWSPTELVSELRASSSLVTDNLQQLQASGLVAPDDGVYRYAPAAAVLNNLCDDLEAAYRERPVTIINMIAKPRDPLQSLADAFKFKGRDT